MLAQWNGGLAVSPPMRRPGEEDEDEEKIQRTHAEKICASPTALQSRRGETRGILSVSLFDLSRLESSHLTLHSPRREQGATVSWVFIICAGV